MGEQLSEVLNTFAEELNILIDAKSAEEALYGLIAFLHNGLMILDQVVLHFQDT